MRRLLLRKYATPPPRRGGRAPPLPAPPVARAVPALDVTGQDSFNAPLYTLKAFTIATAIVVSGAAASIAGVMAYLGVQNTQEFAMHMRTWVSQSMPLLTAKIYRRPTPHDSVEGDPILFAASTPQGDSLSETFDHEAAEQRLAEAFDDGGFDAWVEAAAKETEAEIEVERSRRRNTT